MSTPLEARLEATICELLGHVASVNSLQVVRQFGDDELSPQRLVVACKDDGEDRSVKVSGRFARSVKAKIVLRMNKGDVTASTMEATAGDVAGALNSDSISAALPLLTTLAPYRLLVIHSIDESELGFDKLNWVKQFVATITAMLL